MAESTDYVRCSKCGELKPQGHPSCAACQQPAYDIDSAQLKKARRIAADGSLATGRASISKRTAKRSSRQFSPSSDRSSNALLYLSNAAPEQRCPCASGTWHSDGEAISRAVRQQQNAALLAWPAKVRRERLPRYNPNTGKHEHKWLEMYKAAMPAGFVPSWSTADEWEGAR